MANYGSDQGDVLVLTDEQGNIYAIPRQVVESHRVTEEQRAQMESEIGEDVSGYSMYQQFMNQQMASQHQAESRQAAANARLARQSSTEVDQPVVEAGQEPSRTSGFRGMVTGVWRSLPFTKPASSEA